jgi:hypothetical protein
MFCLSHKCQRCHNFRYFIQHMDLCGIKYSLYNFSYAHGIADPDRPDPDRHALEADPILIRQNDADPTRSGYTTLH